MIFIDLPFLSYNYWREKWARKTWYLGPNNYSLWQESSNELIDEKYRQVVAFIFSHHYTSDNQGEKIAEKHLHLLKFYHEHDRVLREHVLYSLAPYHQRATEF